MPRATPAARGANPRPARAGRGFFTVVLGVALCGASAVAAQQHHGDGGWKGGVQGIPLVTHARPAMAGESYTELYLTQVGLTGHSPLLGGRLQLAGTLNLEGLTLARGELNAGIWGEGYVDRRHPHTLLHEVVGTFWMLRAQRAAATLTMGKGFAPFGTDDPMTRPLVKYPANHHLAQVLERLVAVAAVRAGPLALEAGLFNGDEPTGPWDFPDRHRFGDSWAARLTWLPLPQVEVQGSYAAVASPEFSAGSGLDHRKRSASARFERERHDGERAYVLVEWARTDELSAGRRTFSFGTVLAEAAVRRRGMELAARLERTTRPEEERLEDPFRSPTAHGEAHLIGTTRWTVATAALGLDGWTGSGVRPFVEVSRAWVTETSGSPVFDPAALYGADRLWSVSLGARVEWGTVHRRMGRYGAALPTAPQAHRETGTDQDA